jgi:hypothetical protein
MAGTYSKGTQDLLSKMMRESKLTVHQQKVLAASMSTGGALPASGPRPTAYRREKAPHAPPKTGAWEDPYRGVAFNPRMTQGMGRKPQAQISTDTRGYEREAFRGGGRTVDRDAEKARLQDCFAFGEAGAPQVVTARAAMRATHAVPKRSDNEVLRDKIMTEIEERQQFLAEMRQLGSTKNDAQLRGEIAERMRDLKQLEGLMAQQ